MVHRHPEHVACGGDQVAANESRIHPVPSMAAWVDGSASTANTAFGAASIVVVAVTRSVSMSGKPLRAVAVAAVRSGLDSREAVAVSRFDVDDLLERLVSAGTGDDPRQAVSAELARAVSDGDAMTDALRPDIGGLTILHHAPDLTILHLVWSPNMVLPAHDHRMWAAIAIYTGKEDNAFYRRSVARPAEIEPSGGVTLAAGDVQLLGRETIHSVTNPLASHTGAIHMYGGDFVNEPRSQWGPGELVERPYDMDYVRDLFAAEQTAAC